MANQVQNAGLGNISAAWHNYASRARYLQWGVGTGQAKSATDLASKTGANEARVAGTTAQDTTAVSNDTYKVTGTITAAGTLAVTELGVFDAAGTGTPASGGNMGIYADFAAINLNANDSIAFTVKVAFASA